MKSKPRKKLPNKKIIKTPKFEAKEQFTNSALENLKSEKERLINNLIDSGEFKPKYLINEIEYYFAEDQGRYIIEVNKDSLKKVNDILNKNAVHYDELGVINEDQLFINKKTKVTIDELRTSNTNWLTNYMSK